ncbi:MAG: PHP domain-containing protein [Candidatus Omnitrophota bacterium]
MRQGLMKYADLHTHTYFSDGTFSPQEVIALAKKEGLSCISITDHDSIDAYLSFPFQEEDVELIPGIELTADLNNIEVHILGYLVDYQELWFQEKLREIRRERVSRLEEMCAKLSALGMLISADEVLEFTGNAAVGRLHLARMMVKKGFVSSAQEAFNRFIGDGRSAYVSRFRLKPGEAIALIRKAGGVPVLAHPYSLANQELIPGFVQDGLMGLEAIYPEHTNSQVKRYKELAQKYGLLVTGGSDCHGQAKPEVKMGMIKLPYEYVESLKEAAAKRA